ncbi:hypothetical protein [Micromonospora sp. LOL_023]|uniref:hypothetical protein n=1 Tax=Micromonospora sp. LOL_023 TaxID=3345418 RepID=UPI003A877100
MAVAPPQDGQEDLEIDLTHERPSAKADEVPLQLDRVSVTLRSRLITAGGAVEVKGQLHQAVNLVILCMAGLGTAALTAVVCRSVDVPFWWLTMTLAIVGGTGVFVVGLRLLRAAPGSSDGTTATPGKTS